MDTPIQVDLGRIAQDLQIRRVQVESVVQLLDEGNTVPFITRYRKERTGNLNEVAIREIQVRVGRLRELAERKETILKAIEGQGKLTEELAAAIRAADNPKRLEDLYLPFKPKKKTKASDARDKGLEPLALRIWTRDETLTDLSAAAQEFVSAEKGVESAEQALDGVGHILAEAISEMASVRDAVRRVVWKTGKIVTTKADNIPDGEGLEYRDYFNYSEPIAHIPPHRVLAINRGDKEGPLKVKLEVSRPDLENALFGNLPLEGHPQCDAFRAAALDALDRLLLPSMEREVRRDLTDLAERHAVDVFARNLRSLLLQPPIPKQVVLAIDPGFRTGCKVAVLDTHGNMLEQTVIHPHPPQNRRHEAKTTLKDLVGKHSVGVVAIGNGTACRETEELVAEIIAEGTQFHEAAQAAGTAEAPSGTAADAVPPVSESSAPDEQAVAAEAAEAPASATAPTPSPAAEEPAPAVEEGGADGAVVPHKAHENGESGTSESEHGENPVHEMPVSSLPPISGGAPEEGESESGAESTAVSTPPADESAAPVAEVHSTDHGSSHESAPAAEPTPAPQPAPPEAVAASEPEAATTAPVPTAEEVAVAATAESASPQPGEEAVDAPSIEAATAEPTEEPAPSASVAEAEPAPELAAPPAPALEGGPAPAEAAPAAEAKPAPAAKPAPRPPKPKAPPPPPKPHPADALLAQLAYVIVNEAGASVYSASPVGREEFPEFDASLRGTISIGRRLQDPLAELVKIEPQSIGVGLYQHDINSKQLKESLESVISSCVNFVGVDLNTASVPLLRHVSGLNQLTARRVVDFRKEKGPFRDREQLKEVEGIGPATFTQAAGFLKISEGENPLDRTWVHPESYAAAAKLLETLGFAPDVVRHKDQLPALHEKLAQLDIPTVAKELEIGEPTLRDICEALARPERDPRDDLPKPIFKKGVLKLEDLTAGMELKGTVLNVVDFGAFVDIGLKDSGLVHISQLANRYIKSPHDVVSVGDVVTVWVMGVDQERKRVSLTMVKPGTERPRGGQGGGGGGGRRGGERRPAGAGQGQGQGQGQGGRPPQRRESMLPPQPVGTVSPGGPGPGTEGPPPRRHEPRQGGPGGPRPGGREGGPGRGGPGARPQNVGGAGRFERAQAPRQPTRPSKPAPPPPPLSKDALSGNVPLRTFGQLKQLWQARTEEPTGEEPEQAPEAQANPAPEPAPQEETANHNEG